MPNQPPRGDAPSPVLSLPAHAARLLAGIAQRDVTVGIIGLGYVGVPLALTAGEAGFRVLGFDINGPRAP